jgi:hypothetical protein
MASGSAAVVSAGVERGGAALPAAGFDAEASSAASGVEIAQAQASPKRKTPTSSAPANQLEQVNHNPETSIANKIFAAILCRKESKSNSSTLVEGNVIIWEAMARDVENGTHEKGAGSPQRPLVY